MTAEEQLIDGALRTWKSSIERFERAFSNLSDDQLEMRVAPGRNRLLYVLGHIVVVHDRMLELLDAGPRRHPELDAFFLLSPDEGGQAPVSGLKLNEMLLDVDAALSNAFSAWAPTDWLSKHTAVSAEDFAKEPQRNRFSVLLSRTVHVQFHLGQVVLTEPRS